MVKSEEDITGPLLRELRLKRGQSQHDFWGEVCVPLSTGAYYETERSRMSQPLKRACYLHFYCGLNFQMSQPKKAAALLKQNGLND